MNLSQWLRRFADNPETNSNITFWHTEPARPARYAALPDWVDPRIGRALALRGIHSLYTHQQQAINAVHDGRNIVVVTPTASGKTLCYNIPVLSAIAEDNSARALYLFPTKALSADQVAELYELIEQTGMDVKTYTYDGDTPPAARQAVRKAGHVVVTNPDMLHSGILPHHTKWVKLFENLKFIVIDELHTYKGVFGSHTANVLRRLLRICEFYGSHPQIICCSATIANPLEHAEHITGQEMTLIDDNGAPQGEKHFIFYNPPVVNAQLGIRKSAVLETRKIASDLVKNDISTIVFTRSRVMVELLTSYLKQLVKDTTGKDHKVRGYRGGYLPTERRAIERGLRSGDVRCVVSTNALELGIDIGSLQVCIMCGYPGTISSTWQQSGRSGRRNDVSATIMVGNSSPLNQFMINHPEYFLSKPPENAMLNPDNLYILLAHLKCASFELPFREGEIYGTQPVDLPLKFLEDAGVLRHVRDTWYWSSDEFPASDISLRSACEENFIIVDTTLPEHRVIGEMDRFTAPMLLHDEAIYLHEGKQYQVQKLDFPNRRAYVKSVEVNYYTDADLSVNLRVLSVDKDDKGTLTRSRGDVLVTALTTIFKKMRFDTHENIGFGRVHLPENQMHTTAYWMDISPELVADFTQDELQSGLIGLACVLGNIAPMYVMCDPNDIRVWPQTRSVYSDQPAIFIYDTIPGGMGLSEKLYEMQDELLKAGMALIKSCPCPSGCPSCVGTDGTDKRSVLKLLERLLSATGE